MSFIHFLERINHVVSAPEDHKRKYKMKIQSQQILHTVSAHNSRIIFSKMTFWGALNSNLVQICAFYSRKLPKNWTFDQKMRILLQFQQGA